VRGVAERVTARHPAAWVALLAAVALVARLAPVLRGGGLGGVLAYDDGVYYSAADALLSGRLPYRDYLLLHPPGIVLALAPFAALGRVLGDPAGLGVGRVAFMLVGAGSSVLVWQVARRWSPTAGVVAGLFYALWLPAATTERTTVLEPLVNLGVLGALALLPSDLVAGAWSRPLSRRVAWAGAALGLAVVVKAWAIVPLVVIAWWLARAHGRRALSRFLLSGAAAATIVSLPFFLAAPRAMVEMVVVDQLGRPDNGVGTLERLARVESLPAGTTMTGWAVAFVLVASTAAAVAAALLAWRRPRSRLWMALATAQFAMLLGAPSYFSSYACYAAPALALLVGAASSEVRDAVRRWSPGWAALATPVVGLCALLVLADHVLAQSEGRRFPAAATAAALRGVPCVAADSAAALIAGDVLTRDLRDRCPLVVDVTGLTYNQDTGDLPAGPTPLARLRDVEWQHLVTRYFDGSGAVLLDQWRDDGLHASVLAGMRVEDGRVGGKRFTVLVPARP
jgi:alpha-1,2-mannosyltransferase